jgi:peptidoglycan/LPS O-acetylase OafA/YrhL
MKRITFLDGLRGIAILLVICFHTFSQYTHLVPFGSQYRYFPLFRFGYLGVPLFFLISGFVILMSLEKNKTFFQFIYKRWLRLFPAMLVVTILLYLTMHLLPERPLGIQKLSSAIPGLIFIEPIWIEFLTGIKIELVENSFWSLFVEFKFYFIFGTFYFLFGKKKAVIGIFMLFVYSYVAGISGIKILTSFSNLLSCHYFGWFTGGALAYLYFTDNKIKYLVFAILVSLLQLYKYDRYPGELLCTIIVIAIFFIPVYFEKIRFVFSNRILIFFGFISYPLYLIHENAMIALMLKLNNNISNIPNLLLPVIPLFILAIVAYVIVKIFEPFLIKNIQTIKKRIFPDAG